VPLDRDELLNGVIQRGEDAAALRLRAQGHRSRSRAATSSAGAASSLG
jgi:hypothetical protein